MGGNMMGVPMGNFLPPLENRSLPPSRSGSVPNIRNSVNATRGKDKFTGAKPVHVSNPDALANISSAWSSNAIFQDWKDLPDDQWMGRLIELYKNSATSESVIILESEIDAVFGAANLRCYLYDHDVYLPVKNNDVCLMRRLYKTIQAVKSNKKPSKRYQSRTRGPQASASSASSAGQPSVPSASSAEQPSAPSAPPDDEEARMLAELAEIAAKRKSLVKKRLEAAKREAEALEAAAEAAEAAAEAAEAAAEAAVEAAEAAANSGMPMGGNPLIANARRNCWADAH